MCVGTEYSGPWVEHRSVSRLASPELKSIILDVSSNHIRTGCYTVVQPKRALVMTHYCIARQPVPSLGPVFEGTFVRGYPVNLFGPTVQSESLPIMPAIHGR